MQQKFAPADAVMQIYAESIGLPYVEISEVEIDEELVPKLPAVMARQQSCVPLMMDDGRLLVVTPNQLSPEIEDQLRLRFGVPVRTVLCTPGGIHEAINKHYTREQAAAELAAGPAKAETPKSKAEAKAESETEEKPSRRRGIDPEERAAWKKKQRMGALMGFNFGFMGAMFAAALAGYTLNHLWLSLGAALGVGVIAAGASWVVIELKGP